MKNDSGRLESTSQPAQLTSWSVRRSSQASENEIRDNQRRRTNTPHHKGLTYRVSELQMERRNEMTDHAIRPLSGGLDTQNIVILHSQSKIKWFAYIRHSKWDYVFAHTTCMCDAQSYNGNRMGGRACGWPNREIGETRDESAQTNLSGQSRFYHYFMLCFCTSLSRSRSLIIL